MRNSFYILLILIFYSCQQEKKILIIGDSISQGYTPFVQKELPSNYRVTHSPGNAQHTGYSLEHIDGWVKDKTYDQIYFNWGLWDMCKKRDSAGYLISDKINGTYFSNDKTYQENLEELIVKLKNSASTDLVFVTTTYVPDEEPCRFKEDAKKYDSIARLVMNRNNIRILDITDKSRLIHKKYGVSENDVHYKKMGYQLLAKIISEDIK